MALLHWLKTPFAEKYPEGTAALPAGPGSAGDALRQQRQALGLEIADVAAALRIKPAYLAALEAGLPDRLPGHTYAIGFMRAYADHLGLDSGEILRRFRQGSTAFSGKPDLSFPMPLGERSVPGGGMLLVGLILALCGYGTWYYVSTGERSRPERVAEVPAELLAPKPTQRPNDPAAARSMEALAAPPVTAPGADPAAPSDALATPAAAPGAPPNSHEGLSQTAAIAPAPQGPSSAADAPTRIVIRAIADSWVQIRDAGQSVLFTQTLKAGDSYAVPDRPGLAMRTGNAGGLAITVDGSPAPPIGRMGAVKRNVALEPQALLAGAAVRD
jgi:cytoskeleton protein RodZ